MSEYDLVVSFPDQSETFVLGFEAGMIWQRLESGDLNFTATVHSKNSELFMRMAYAKELFYKITATGVEGWSELVIRPLEKPVPKLRLIKGGLAAIVEHKP